jgi:hypothetical protein
MPQQTTAKAILTDTKPASENAAISPTFFDSWTIEATILEVYRRRLHTGKSILIVCINRFATKSAHQLRAISKWLSAMCDDVPA